MLHVLSVGDKFHGIVKSEKVGAHSHDGYISIHYNQRGLMVKACDLCIAYVDVVGSIPTASILSGVCKVFCIFTM